eukprot:2778228-Amphidinium_carterae.1
MVVVQNEGLSIKLEDIKEMRHERVWEPYIKIVAKVPTFLTTRLNKGFRPCPVSIGSEVN